MRIIKLSPKDVSFPDRTSIDRYFDNDLPNRNPRGMFCITQGKIGKDGIAPGESIVFSYQTEITHIAKAASKRIAHSEDVSGKYPYYFIVDLETVCPAQGHLYALEAALFKAGIEKHIVNTRSWPKIPGSERVEAIWNELKNRLI